MNKPSEDMLFLELFGNRFEEMPKAWKKFHMVTGTHCHCGEAVVRRGSNLMMRLLATVVRLPPISKVGVELTIVKSGNGESWQRVFGSSVFKTQLSPARGGGDLRLEECFGPFRFEVQLIVGNDDALGKIVNWEIINWWFLGIRLPQWLAPISKTIEFQDSEGRYGFDIDLELRFFGRLISYQGWLVIE